MGQVPKKTSLITILTSKFHSYLYQSIKTCLYVYIYIYIYTYKVWNPKIKKNTYQIWHLDFSKNEKGTIELGYTEMRGCEKRIIVNSFLVWSIRLEVVGSIESGFLNALEGAGKWKRWLATITLSLCLVVTEKIEEKLYIYININYVKTQNQIREIGNKTQRYSTKKFKEKKHKTLYYITWKLHNLKNILIRRNNILQ